MGLEFLQEEPKLILTYPHKSKFNRIGFSSMVVLSFIVMSVLSVVIIISLRFLNCDTCPCY